VSPNTKTPSLTPWGLLLPPTGVILLLWLTRVSEVSPEDILYAFLLFLVPWTSFQIWEAKNQGGLPIFALVGFAYWWYFAIGLFWLDRVVFVGRYGNVTAGSVTETMRMALVAILCVWAGMKVPLPVPPPDRQFEIDGLPGSWLYVRVLLLGCTALSFVPNVTLLVGGGARNILEILLDLIPTVALLMLLRKCLSTGGEYEDRVTLWIYFPLRLLAGLASGWLGSVAILAVLCGAGYYLTRYRIPWKMVIACALAILFLQVGKRDFRSAYWYGDTDGGVLDKAVFWVTQSASIWTGAATSENEGATRDKSNESLERTSLLKQAGHVLDLLPEQVPFQMGKTYSYLLISLIPRVVWPEKPSINEANHFYQIAFGLSDERDTQSTNIGVGCMVEAYINFGWLGVIVVMFVIGVVLSAYERAFFSPGSSALFVALGVALLRGFLAVESQLAAYIGGLIQNVGFTILVFLPIIRRQSVRSKVSGNAMASNSAFSTRFRPRPSI